MAIKKVRPIRTNDSIKEVKEVVVKETPEEAAGNSVPTWEPNNDPPATYEQDETHNLALPFDVNDPTR
jgi:hypothetical protein